VQLIISDACRGLMECAAEYLPDAQWQRCMVHDNARGWSMSAEMTAQLVTDALVMAIWRRGKPDALLHHSDRGSQYISEQFQKLMADHGVVCSMSRSGNVWDNAAMESFFSSLKTERTARKTYRTRDDARADVFDYIERFYNAKRRHSKIGYRSPMEFELQAGLV
jgi:putative transposase